MEPREYERHVRSEAAARRLLLSYVWKGGGRYCPRCRNGRVYELADGRLRCGACRYTFQDFSGRFLNVGGLSCRDWLRLLRLFELERTVSRMADQLGLAYNTVYRAVTVVRFSIMANALDAAQLLFGEVGRELGYDNGRMVMSLPEEPGGPIPVFGIIEKPGWTFLDLVPDMRVEHVVHFNMHFSLKVTRLGRIVYTDRYQHYDALMFCGGDDAWRYADILDRTPYLDTRPGGFWSYARARLSRFSGVSARRFPLYLKELEFRYNHRNESILPILLTFVSSLVPKHD
ncbi:MAG: transposase [Thermodesulfobacteriota bacterium]